MTRLGRHLLLSTLALAACNSQVQGNGELGVEQRTVAPFDAVEISLGIEAAVTANAATQALSLSGDSNLLPYILTPVEAGLLRTVLHDIGGIDPINPLRLSAQAVTLHRVRAAEASIVDVNGAGSAAAGFAFTVEADGRSSVSLAGPGGHELVVKLSGGAALDAWSYPVASANLLLTGGSLLRLNCSGDPTGSAADKSSVTVTGGGRCDGLTLTGEAKCERR
jgi:hypothetical protein